MLCWKSRGCRLCWSKRTIKSGPRRAESDAVDVEKPTSGRLFPCHAPCFATEQYLAEKKKQLVGDELEQLLE